MSEEKERVELDCVLVNETDKAFKVEIMVGKKTKTFWFPKSQSEVIANRKGSKLMLAHWLAEKEGLL